MFGKSKNELKVQVEQLPDISEIDGCNLVEIKDENVIRKIKSAVPGLCAVVGNTAAVVQGTQLANTGVYQAILPAGAKLVKSKDMQGAVRGFFRQGDRIAGHANLVSVDGTVNKIASVNLANAAMGAAALVVGQYYMTQINDELKEMNHNLEKISDFQMAEYKGRVFTLIAQIKRASDFQAEILADNNLRNEEISRLQNLETTCMELLNQANVSISNLIGKEGETFEQYEKMFEEVAIWQKYQVILIETLYIIADLNYTLHLGALSKEQCYSVYSGLYDSTNDLVRRTKRWHEIHGKKFHIDVDQARRERQGIDAVIHKPLELINEDFKYKNLGKEAVVNIRQQKNIQMSGKALDMRDRFNENVCVIAKDGKVYYRVE